MSLKKPQGGSLIMVGFTLFLAGMSLQFVAAIAYVGFLVLPLITMIAQLLLMLPIAMKRDSTMFPYAVGAALTLVALGVTGVLGINATLPTLNSDHRTESLANEIEDIQVEQLGNRTKILELMVERTEAEVDDDDDKVKDIDDEIKELKDLKDLTDNEKEDLENEVKILKAEMDLQKHVDRRNRQKLGKIHSTNAFLLIGAFLMAFGTYRLREQA